MTDAELSGGAARGPEADPGHSQGNDIEARVQELEAQLAEAQAEAGRLREEWLRAKAETENVRRRSQEEVGKAHKFGVEGFAAALLAVKDSLDAALAVENASIESFKEGMEITSRQLDAAFEKNGIRGIAPLGEKFDPHRHQAISQVEDPAEPNTVVSVLQKGYLIHDRVLRPALVVVSKAPSGDRPAAGA